MNLVFLGSPGVGKGTYAQVLRDALKIPHISTGDLLREEAKKETPEGKKIKEAMEKGLLVDDKTTLAVLEKRLSEPDCKRGFILDGFPRNKVQAAELERIIDIDHVLNFLANDEVIIERLSGRMVCDKCKTIYHTSGNMPKVNGICDKCHATLAQRADDSPQAVAKRLYVYKKETAPLIEYYQNKGLLTPITINRPISEIREKVITTVKAFLTGKIHEIGEIK